MTGCMINLDKDPCSIRRGMIYDKISNVCTFLEVEFVCDSFFVFDSTDGSSYFTYNGLNWVPYSNIFNGTNTGQYYYNIKAIPYKMCQMIDTPCNKTSLLASSAGLRMSDSSMNLDLKLCLTNLSLYSLMKRHRLQSLKDSYAEKNMENAFWLYCSGDTLYCYTWKNLISQQANSLQFTEMESSIVTSQINDVRIQNELSIPQVPKQWDEKDYLNWMSGISFSFNVPKPLYFAQKYSIKYEDNDNFDYPESFLCSSSAMNLTDDSKCQVTLVHVNLPKER